MGNNTGAIDKLPKRFDELLEFCESMALHQEEQNKTINALTDAVNELRAAANLPPLELTPLDTDLLEEEEEDQEEDIPNLVPAAEPGKPPRQTSKVEQPIKQTSKASMNKQTSKLPR